MRHINSNPTQYLSWAGAHGWAKHVVAISHYYYRHSHLVPSDSAESPITEVASSGRSNELFFKSDGLLAVYKHNAMTSYHYICISNNCFIIYPIWQIPFYTTKNSHKILVLELQTIIIVFIRMKTWHCLHHMTWSICSGRIPLCLLGLKEGQYRSRLHCFWHFHWQLGNYTP